MHLYLQDDGAMTDDTATGDEETEKKAEGGSDRASGSDEA